MDNLTIIKQEFENLKGQFVITDSWTIERLVAIGDDQQDYYYVTYDGRKLTWNTCVGRVVPLKGYLRDKDYNEFVRLAKLNHFDQASLWGRDPQDPAMAEARRKHKVEMETLEENHSFLTPFCWELN